MKMEDVKQRLLPMIIKIDRGEKSEILLGKMLSEIRFKFCRQDNILKSSASVGQVQRMQENATIKIIYRSTKKVRKACKQVDFRFNYV